VAILEEARSVSAAARLPVGYKLRKSGRERNRCGDVPGPRDRRPVPIRLSDARGEHFGYFNARGGDVLRWPARLVLLYALSFSAPLSSL
jgi:hypothetical protein